MVRTLPPSSHLQEGFDFFKIDKNGGGGLEIFARKEDGWGRGEDKMGALPYHIEVFLEIPHDAAQEKNLDVFLSPLLTNVLQNNCL